PATVDGMGRAKIAAIIHALRQERYRGTPGRRPYVGYSIGSGLAIPHLGDLGSALHFIPPAWHAPAAAIVQRWSVKQPGRGEARQAISFYSLTRSCRILEASTRAQVSPMHAVRDRRPIDQAAAVSLGASHPAKAPSPYPAALLPVIK